MGISERKEREKLARRKMIMDCAKELILSSGVDGVSMSEIAKRTELSKATLYLYFPSKDELFNEICEESANVFIDHAMFRIEEGITGPEALKRYWAAYLEVFGQGDEMMILFNLRRFLFPPSALRPDTGNSTSTAVRYTYMLFNLIKEMIDQGISEGFFDTGTDSEVVARTIISLFSYIVENVVKLPKDERTSSAVIEEMRNVFQILLRGIAREGIDRSVFNLPSVSPAS